MLPKIIKTMKTKLPKIIKTTMLVLASGLFSAVFALGTAIAAVEDQQQQQQGGSSPLPPPLCNHHHHQLVEKIISNTADWSIFDDTDVTWNVHRNGQAHACGSIVASTTAMRQALLATLDSGCDEDVDDEEDESEQPAQLDKYELESFLTTLVANEFLALDNDACGPEDDEEATSEGFFGYCDMGPLRTVLQPDSDDLIPTPDGTLPCRFFTREGMRISSLQQLADLARVAKKKATGNSNPQQEECSAVGDDAVAGELCSDSATAASVHLYAVPAGRVFMFAPSYVGETFEISHVQGLPNINNDNNTTIVLEVLSVEPRVFDVHNFFSVEEAQGLIAKALTETSETYGLHRSTTGTANQTGLFNKRTSENAWDTGGKLSTAIKRRCLNVLGFDEYYESHTDGLQILRYNETKAYVEHMDYLDNNPSEDYDYDSSGNGGNRFATILLYMNDLESGGETVFPAAPSPFVGDDVSPALAIRQLRESGELDMVAQGSWEEQMIGTCRTRLVTKPRSSRAVLFYSQYPNGQKDLSSKHGGCPTIKGTKWAANLWVWNAARAEYDTAPVKPGREGKPPAFKKVSATFQNTGADERYKDAQLYYGDETFFGELGAGKTIHVNTFETHVWNIKSSVDGTILRSWEITGEKEEEVFVL